MTLRVKNFLLGLITFIIILNLVISRKEIDEKKFNSFNAKFNKIDGVNVGTDVVISGIKVGHVRNISINDNFPQIFMSIEKDIKITDDSSVSIQTDGLFGKKFLIIEIGGSENYLKNGDNFSFAEDSIVIEELLQKIIEIGEKNKEI
jgi:phospholipid/cholesterol/gamma-HCH transport system substrate-binding protein